MHICINERDFSGRNHNFHFRRFFSSRFETVLSSSSSKGGLKVMWLKDLRRKVFKSLICSYSGTSRNTKDFQQFHLKDPIQMGWPHSNMFNNTLQCSIIQYHSWSFVNLSSKVIVLCSDEINVFEKTPVMIRFRIDQSKYKQYNSHRREKHYELLNHYEPFLY